MFINDEPLAWTGCQECKKGILMRITLSRLEEGLGHEAHKCDTCGYSVKYVPLGESPSPEELRSSIRRRGIFDF